MYFKKKITESTSGCWDDLQRLRTLLQEASAVVIGAGAGLSASAGFDYSGKRFKDNFSDFIEKYGFRDMYSGGFHTFECPEEYWAYWSRYISINRYEDTDNGTYKRLLELLLDKDYFVLTTNVDHQFQKAGFDKQRLFYTQGDYGLFQCSVPCRQITYDNEETVRRMKTRQSGMKIPSDLIPRCPVCGKPMAVNLRADHTFVQDKGWYTASERYTEFIRRHQNKKVLFWELGVGMNTPGIIKYPFWEMTDANPQAAYACLNSKETFAPSEIAERSVCIQADIREVLFLI